MIEETTPTEGEALVASARIEDADGVTNAVFHYQWQQSAPGGGDGFTDIAGATEESFTPGPDQVNRQLRVVVTYVDDAGNAETVVSETTAVTGDFIAPGTRAETLTGTEGRDLIFGGNGADTLNGLGGDDFLEGGNQNDQVNAGAGDDTISYTIGNGIDDIDGGDGQDTLEIRGTAGNNLLAAAVTAGALTGVAGGSVVNVEVITAALGDGTDTLNYAGTSEGIRVDLGAGTATGFTSIGGIENVVGGSGNDLLVDAAGVTNVLTGGAGDDTFVVHDSSDVVNEGADGGTDTVQSVANTYTIANGNVENLGFVGTGSFTGTGNGAANVLTGGAGDDVLNGMAGDDTLHGGTGNDTLSGGTGDDVVDAGDGDDTIHYVFGEGADAMDGGAGQDALRIAANAAANALSLIFSGGTLTAIAGGSIANIESVTADLGDGSDTLNYAGSSDAVTVDLGAGSASGFASITGVENVSGGSGNDLLADAAGVTNTLNGGAGDDTFVVHDTADVVVEATAGGTDEVRSFASTYTIANANVENLAFAGSGSFSGTGNAAANVITGGAGDDLLSGLAGNDTLFGGAGNDILDGGAGNDVLEGGDGDDVLNGGLGNDTLRGGAGNDTINYTFGQGADLVDGGGGLEGNAGYDRLNITGTAGANAVAVVVAAGMVNSLAGGAVSGIEYIALDLQDGTDTLNYGGTLEAVSVNLATGAASGFTSVAGVENVTGGSGNDLLAGAAGVTNTLTGGAGDDTFIVHDSEDVVIEAMAGGTDEVRSSAATYTIANANVENLSFAGNGNFSGTGNAASNVLTGGSGDDVLAGLAGNDTLRGGAGNDNLAGGIGNDMVDAGDGDDTIQYAIGDGSDAVDGGSGQDTLAITGTAAASTLAVVAAGGVLTSVAGGSVTRVESVTANLGDGTDTLSYAGTSEAVAVDLGAGSASGFTAIAAIENVVGGLGNDLLADAAGIANVLMGGSGDDTYIVHDTGDTVTEAAGGGTDEVQSHAGSYTIANAAVENLRFVGSGNFAGTGNSGANTLTGGSGDDVLSGLAGNDTLHGGDGSDVLAGGAGNDAVNGGAGNDTIQYAIGEGVDAMDGGSGQDTLAITGTAAANSLAVVAAGGTLVNVAGGSVANIESVSANLGDGVDTLSYAGTAEAVTVDLGSGSASGFASLAGIENVVGGSGNDVLAGAAGVTNTLTGGAGDDVFVVHDTADVVVEAAAGGTDEVRSLAGNYTIANANVENLSFAGTGNFSGTGNASANTITGGSGDDVLSGLGGNDLLNGGAGNDALSGGIGNDLLNGGAGNDALDGGAGNDVLSGSEGDDLLAAGDGTDQLNGGAGNDVLNGGLGLDIFVFQSAFGQDRIEDFDASAVGGQDRMDVSALGINAANFGAAVAIGLADVDANGVMDTVVSIGSDSITLLGVTGVGDNAITSADFILA